MHRDLSTDTVNTPGENLRASSDSPAPTPLHGSLTDLRPDETLDDSLHPICWREDWPDIILVFVVFALFFGIVGLIWRWL